MKYSVTNIGEENEPIEFNNNILGNYSTDSFLGNFNPKISPFLINYVNSHIEIFSQNNLTRCLNFEEETIIHSLFWKLFFYGSRSNDGSRAGCMLVSPKGEKNMLAYRLEFECTNH